MKKILVAAALAFVASTASAAIAGSRHDFMTNGYLTTPPASACVFCHTAHHATSTVVPLWVRNVTAPTTWYGTNNAVPGTTERGINACLGCHATGAAADMGTDNSLTVGGTNGPATTAIISTVLDTTHPVGSNTVISAVATTSLKAAGFISLGGLGTLAGGEYVTCAMCHDVHNSTSTGAGLLRDYSVAGDFCNSCHNK